MAAHFLLGMIDGIKEELPDGVYKDFCDKLAELNKEQEQEPKYARVYGCLLTTHCDDGHCLYDNAVNLLVELVDPNEVNVVNHSELGVEKGKVTKDFVERMQCAIHKRGYMKVGYNRNGDTELIVLKCEFINP